MKIVAGFLFLIVAANADPITRKYEEFAIDGIFGQFLESLRELMKQGDPETGIPILDPYEFKYAQWELPGPIINLSTNISDATLAGLSDFQVLKLNLDKHELALDFEIYFPNLNFTAEYFEMQGSIMHAFPLKGEGILHVEVYSLNLSSKIFLIQSENQESILIERFESPQFSVGRILSKTDFDDNFDDIFNAMIEDILPDYLNRFNRYIAHTYSNPAISALNKIPKKINSW